MSHSEKMTIAFEYLQTKAGNDDGNEEPDITALSGKCKVSRRTILKVRDELRDYGRVLSPEEIRSRANSDTPSGPGSRAMTPVDEAVLFALYLLEPSRSLKSYKIFLYNLRGIIVDESTISRWFNHSFPIKGSLRKANLIPYDKLRPGNIEGAVDYVRTIAMLDRSKIKFGDEKHLKGAELYCRKTRRNILTGEVPPNITTPDFRNTYSIIGFCGIDGRTTPMRYGIMEGINDAENFCLQIQLAVLTGFLLPGDILVLDRAAIHIGGCNETLQDWLWDNFRVFILLLPARCTE